MWQLMLLLDEFISKKRRSPTDSNSILGVLGWWVGPRAGSVSSLWGRVQIECQMGGGGERVGDAGVMVLDA